MPKPICRTILFAMILTALLAAVSIPFRHKMNPEDPQILLEPMNTVDVVILGDSEAEYAYIPMQIWRDYGIAAYNCGDAGQRLYMAEDLLRVIVPAQHPQIVLLETDMLYNSEDWTDILLSDIGMVSHLIRNHDAWKPTGLWKWPVPVMGPYRSQSKGYYYINSVLPADSAGYMTPTGHVKPVSEEHCSRLERMANFCRENGVRLVLISTTSTVNWNYERHNAVSALAETLDIEYLDLNAAQAEVPIDWEKDTYDRGDHMNYAGAAKVTAYVGAYLSRQMGLEDKRGDPGYARWNAGCDAFWQQVERLEKEAAEKQ